MGHLCRHKNLSPSIDKGQAGSKTIRSNRTAFWQIKCRGEPPPVFTWWHPVHGELSGTNNEYTVHTEDYQGGSVTTLVIHHAKKSDHGTYQLQAENRNGKEKIDLDLIVLEGEDDDCHIQPWRQTVHLPAFIHRIYRISSTFHPNHEKWAISAVLMSSVDQFIWGL